MVLKKFLLLLVHVVIHASCVIIGEVNQNLLLMLVVVFVIVLRKISSVMLGSCVLVEEIADGWTINAHGQQQNNMLQAVVWMHQHCVNIGIQLDAHTSHLVVSIMMIKIQWLLIEVSQV